MDCSSLTSVVVEEGNTKYDSRDNCNAIIETSTNTLIAGCKNTTIPSSVTSIGDYAFCGCNGLTSITIPNSVTSIGASAFFRCSGLTSMSFPNSVTSIGDYAFSECCGLVSINIPSNVTSIGAYSFSRLSGLLSITIPSSVTSIGDNPFGGCSNLTSIVVEAGNLKYDSRSNCNAIIETETNTLITGCKNTSIPNNVTSIGDDAFDGCSGLNSVTIPNSVLSIEWLAFNECNNLTDVYCYAETVPTTDSHAFDATPIRDVTLHVLESSIDAYQTASPWSDFKEIVAISQDIAMATSSGSPRSMKGYSSEYGLDFTNVSDVKAYIAVGFTGEKNVILASVNIVPANTGMILRTDNPGVEVDVPITNSEVYYANLLKPALNNVTIQPSETIGGVEYTNLMVGTDSDTGLLGFITFSNAVTRSNNCYLSVPTTFFQSAASARQGGLDMIFVDSETTTDIQSLMQSGIITDDIYDLQGRKVTATKKGLYIRNGKKVYVK